MRQTAIGSKFQVRLAATEVPTGARRLGSHGDAPSSIQPPSRNRQRRSAATAPTLSPRTMGRSDGWATRRSVRGEDGIYAAPGRDREINPDIPDIPEWQTLWPSAGRRVMHVHAGPSWIVHGPPRLQNYRNYRDCRDCSLGFIWRGVCVRRPARRPQRPRILWQRRDGGSARRAVAAYRPLRSARSA